MRALALLLLIACSGKSAPGPSTTSLVVTVTDGGKPVAARVLLFAADGEPVRIGVLDLYKQRQGTGACPIAEDVIGSWNGLILARGSGEIPIGRDTCNPSPAIPYGKYKVWAWRGIEYEKWEGEVDLSANKGKVPLAIALSRAWTPTGTLAADLHVHAQASNDSTLPNRQRVVAQVAAGVQVVGLSDHNRNGSLHLEIEGLGLSDVIAAIPSNELTSEHLHVNVYPVAIDPTSATHGGPEPSEVVRADAATMFAIARRMQGVRPNWQVKPVVQLNHPRFRFTALYDVTKWDGISWPPPFPIDYDAVEVLAGYSAINLSPNDRRFDESTRDYFTFVDHGHLLIPVGNSDTHDLNWVLDGTARTYVFVDDPKTQPFDDISFMLALQARRVVATSGPWLDVEVSAGGKTVGPGQSLHASGKVSVDIELAQAGFVKAERITITIGSPQGPRVAGVFEKQTRVKAEIEVGSTDTWLCVTADGDTPMPKEITGTYQQDKWKRPGVTPFAITGPVLIDADGDGRWKRGDADIALP